MSTIRRRSLFVRLAVAVVLSFVLAPAATTAQTQIQEVEDSEFYFEGDDGNVVLSNATVGFVDAGYGNFIAVLTMMPTQEEIDELLLTEWSHVDFAFRFRGLEPSEGGVYFAPAVSDYARQVGAWVDLEDGYPIYHAMGLNIDGRWSAGEPLTVYALISGFERSGDSRPSVSIEMVSSKWWFPEDTGCTVVYERTTNNQTLQYCTEQDLDSRATLYDEDGDTRFRLD